MARSLNFLYLFALWQIKIDGLAKVTTACFGWVSISQGLIHIPFPLGLGPHLTHSVVN